MPFFLRIRQQPTQGRMSGFSNNHDRRSIEPHLILQALYRHEDGRIDTYGSSPDWQQLICHVTLMKQDGVTSAGSVLNSTKSRVKNNIISDPTQLRTEQLADLYTSLLGTPTVQGEVYQDIDGSNAVFFIFGDLAVRSRGFVTNKFHTAYVRLIPVSKILDQAMTDTLTVYSPKLYPGVIDSPPLTKWLYSLGAKLYVRKNHDFSKSNSRSPSIEESAGEKDKNERKGISN